MDGDKLLAILMTVVAILVVSILGLVIWLAATGGFYTVERERIGGVVCVITRSRISGSPHSVSCPPIQKEPSR